MPKSRQGVLNLIWRVSDKRLTNVYADERVNIGELVDLDPKAIELRCKNSDLSIWVHLPNKVERLVALAT